jgi:hypothetical protein
LVLIGFSWQLEEECLEIGARDFDALWEGAI